MWIYKRMITLWRKPAASRYATTPSIDSVDLYSVGDEPCNPISPWHLLRDSRNSRSRLDARRERVKVRFLVINRKHTQIRATNLRCHSKTYRTPTAVVTCRDVYIPCKDTSYKPLFPSLAVSSGFRRYHFIHKIDARCVHRPS